MTLSRYPHITDELLSAYLDEAVTAEEKLLIETAVAAEPTLAWRLETLRQTVQLVRTLPAIALPRSFTLSELPGAARQPAPALAGSLPARRAPLAVPHRFTGLAGLWKGWRSFWQMGSPLLRNAAAVSLALFLLLTVGDVLGSSPVRQASGGASAPFAGEAPAAAAFPSATATSQPLTPPGAGSIQESIQEEDGQVAKESAAPPPPPAGASEASAGEAGAVETAAGGVAAGTAPAGQPDAQLSSQEETFARAAGAPGPDGREELAPMDQAGDAVTNSQTVPAESLSAAMGTRTALAATDATTVTTDEIAASDERVLAPAAQLSDTETLTLPEPDQSVTADDGGSTADEEADDATTLTSPTPAAQAEEAVTSTTGAENGEANEVAASPQGVEEVQPDQEVAPVDSLRRSLLDLSQLATALVTLVFGALWWRSRSQSPTKF